MISPHPSVPGALLPADRKAALVRLRETLSGKFPQAHLQATQHPVPHPMPQTASGNLHPLPNASDLATPSPLPESMPLHAFPITHPSLPTPLLLRHGEISEAYGALGSGALLLEAALRSTAEARSMMGLVDGRSAFDPALPVPLLSRLLWVMSRDAATAIKATDLLLRDGNLPLIALDLQLNPPEELRRIPSTTWYRFQRILEQSSTSLLILTSRPMITSAAVRIALDHSHSLPALHQWRASLPLEVRFQRRHSHPRSWRQTA